MTREAAGTVSVPRDNARSERVCGGVSAAIATGAAIRSRPVASRISPRRCSPCITPRRTSP